MMRHTWLMAALLVFTVGCAQKGPTPPDVVPVPTGTPARSGEDLFTTQCAGCHMGGGNAMVASKPVKGSVKLADVATFTAFLRNPGGMMPAFPADVLSDADLASLHAYLQKTYPATP
jgi:mono/diheme cytochrome c family protein